MDKLKMELKKIWSPITILVIILVAIPFFYLFRPSFERDFDNKIHGQEKELYDGWAKKYGVQIDDREAKDIEKQLDSEKTKFSDQLKKIDGTKKFGIVDLESLQEALDNLYSNIEENHEKGKDRPESSQELEDLHWYIFDNTNLNKVRAISAFLEGRSQKIEDTSSGGYGEIPKPTEDRINEISKSSDKYGYMPEFLIESLKSNIMFLPIWIILSVTILLAPSAIRDRASRVIDLQYSSKTGRKIVSIQNRAALLTSIGISLLTVIIYGIILWRWGFLNYGNFTIINQSGFSYLYWLDIDFKTYLLLYGLMLILLGVTTGQLITSISQTSNNYTTILIKAVPIVVVLSYLSMRYLFNNTFRLFNEITKIIPVAGIELKILLALLAISIVVLFFTSLHKRKMEL